MMEGLLCSEFRLLLRDSVNNTPRRRFSQSTTAPTSPISALSPQSYAKEPKAIRAGEEGIASLGLRLNIVDSINDSVGVEGIPTSPTSPLPIQTPSSSSCSSTPTSPIASSSSTSLSLIHFSPISISKSSCSTKSLDVLASVSAEQLDKSDRRYGSTSLPVSPLPSPSSSSKSFQINKSINKKQSGNGKIFKCNLCPSTFSQQFNLNKHVRAVHERRRPFQCNVCRAKFQQKSHRTMHYLAVHEKLRQFSCDHCPASFSWRGVLKKHRKSIHGIDE